jgi:hypothetical protein
MSVVDGLDLSYVTRYAVTRYRGGYVAEASERMRAMRERRRAQGMRELRLFVPDARSQVVRRRIARQVAKLDSRAEREAMCWIEAVSEFDSK